jgi:hypothetical protein
MGAPCANSRRLRWGSERFKIVAYIAYIAYNFHFDTMPAGRPASIRTRNFLRHLTDTEAAILAHAGDGDISAGFKNLLDWYQQMHCQSGNANDFVISDSEPKGNS